MTTTTNLLQQVVHILCLCGRVGEDTSEEVHFVSKWLIANHGHPLLHHLGFDLWCHLRNQTVI